ncbi:glycosyl hydrolase family 28-related protein [Paenibacillus hodogayensis]|uniref:Glycosyl hydrolase family 28-related protein n=1 Tax=Paenibacillus hodogayensis TaxID=279208 RepID=A0ABV5VRT1_9BACL
MHNSKQTEPEQQGTDQQWSRRKLLAAMGISGAILGTQSWLPTSFADSSVTESVYGTCDGLEEQITKLKRDVEERGLLAIDFGAAGDGTTDDTSAIQAGIDAIAASGGGTLVLTGIHLITHMLDLKRQVALYFVEGSRLHLKANTKGLNMQQDTALLGKAYLYVDVNGYTESALYLNAALVTGVSYQYTYIETLRIEGNVLNNTGNGIHLDAASAPSRLSFVRFNNLRIRGFGKGIFMDAPPHVGDTVNYNYITGNILNNVVISDCDYYIYGTGDHTALNQVDGNTFNNVQLQYNNRCKEMIHLEGRGNIVNAFIWDAINKNCLMVNLTPSTRQNQIFLNFLDGSNYIDAGQYNYLSLRDLNGHKIPYKEKLTYLPSGDYRKYNGDYEDIFHAAPVLHQVSIVSGADKIVEGNLDHVFQGKTNQYLRLNLAGGAVFAFEVVFNGNHYYGNANDYVTGGIENVGIYFMYNRCPEQIRLDVTDLDGVLYTTVQDMQHMRYLPAYTLRSNVLNGLMKGVRKIKFTFTGQYAVDVRLGRVFGHSYSIGGNKYLANSGDYVAGDLTFIQSGHGVVLTSPNGSKFKLKVSDSGALTIVEL